MNWTEKINSCGEYEAVWKFLCFKIRFHIVNLATNHYEYWYVFRNAKFVYDAHCSKAEIMLFIEQHPFAKEHV